MRTPKVYVGTYAKYNAGSLDGKWLSLDDYTDKDEFEAACQELHGPGEHEFMFQDTENIPSRFISESRIDPEVWSDWVFLDDEDRNMFEAYLDCVDSAGTLDQARESFAGNFDSRADWAAEYWGDTGMLQGVHENLQNYIDYDAFARDCKLDGSVVFAETYNEVWVFNKL